MPRTFAEMLEDSTKRSRAMEAPVVEQLRTFADDVRALSPEFADVVERMIDRLRRGGAGLAAPAVGDPMPPFLLPDQDGRLLSLDELLRGGPAVVAFLRGHWCPYCRIYASALAALHGEVQQRGGRLVAITPERQEFTSKLQQDAGAPYPILSDLDNAYALQLNLAIWVGQEKKQAMQAAGWDVSPYQGNDAWLLPIPATFVVGPDGVVKARFVDPDYRTRMAIDDIRAALGSA